MNATLTAPYPLSRPKIHRLPAAWQVKPEPKIRVAINYPLVISCVGVFGLLVAAQLHKRPANVATGQISKLQSSTSHLIPAPVSDAMASVPVPGKPGQTIVLQDKSEIIIGQLTRIPSETEQITEIKPITEVDKSSGRELLSIISKY